MYSKVVYLIPDKKIVICNNSRYRPGRGRKDRTWVEYRVYESFQDLTNGHISYQSEERPSYIPFYISDFRKSDIKTYYMTNAHLTDLESVIRVQMGQEEEWVP